MLTLCSPKGERAKHILFQSPDIPDQKVQNCPELTEMYPVLETPTTHQRFLTLNFWQFSPRTLMHHYLILNAICRGFRTWGHLENVRHFSSSGHFCILICPGLVHWGAVEQFKTSLSYPSFKSHLLPEAFNNLPLGNRNTALFMALFGWATGKLAECREPNTFFTVWSSFHWYSIKVY